MANGLPLAEPDPRPWKPPPRSPRGHTLPTAHRLACSLGSASGLLGRRCPRRTVRHRRLRRRQHLERRQRHRSADRRTRLRPTADHRHLLLSGAGIRARVAVRDVSGTALPGLRQVPLRPERRPRPRMHRMRSLEELVPHQRQRSLHRLPVARRRTARGVVLCSSTPSMSSCRLPHRRSDLSQKYPRKRLKSVILLPTTE